MGREKSKTGRGASQYKDGLRVWYEADVLMSKY